MALTGNGLRVPRGPIGFLAGLIDGLQPSMPAIRAQQQWRREKAAEKEQSGSSGDLDDSVDEGISPAHDMRGSYSFPKYEPQEPESDEEAGIPPRHPLSALPSQEAFGSRYAGSTTGRRAPAAGTVRGSRRVGHGAPATPESFGRLSRTFGLPAGPQRGTLRAGGGAQGTASGRSDAERYASHLQAAGLPEAVVRQLTAERYGV